MHTFQGNSMKHVKLVRKLIAVAALAVAAGGANAESILANPISGPSFTDVLIGTINVSTLSDLTGSMFAATDINFGAFALSLGSVTFTSTNVGSLSGDLDPSSSGFSFKNVVAGIYTVKASGSITGGAIPNLAFIGANYTVTPVPEPETFAMLLAGLGLMGAIARRRNKSAS